MLTTFFFSKVLNPELEDLNTVTSKPDKTPCLHMFNFQIKMQNLTAVIQKSCHKN